MNVYMKWWIFGPLIGLLTLSQIRCDLFENNLFDTYAEGEWPAVQCDADDLIYRSYDGRCNDLDLPAMGMAGVRMGRNINPEVSFPDTDNLMNPNPRTLSEELLTRESGIREVPFLNYLAANWIQFMIHDWFEHGLRDHSNPHQVPVAANDPHNDGSGNMPVGRTPDDPSRDLNDGRAPTFINENTAWWDGSQIYGSDIETNHKLRTFSGGQMILENGRLPMGEDGLPETGFNRNWWIGLEMMHTLWVKEHNAIAAHLQSAHPNWDDERLFQTARLINAALMAKVHTVDWTPAILKNYTLREAMFANWRGLMPYWFPKLGNEATDGIMGGSKKLEGVPFSLTEEFTAVYRMHPLLRDSVEIRDHNNHNLLAVSQLPDHALQGSSSVSYEHGLTNLFYSFGHTHPGLLELNNFPTFLQNFPAEPGVANLDLGAVDILRDRERGIPRYNEFRRQIGLNPITDFTDITPDTAMAEKLRELYNDDIEMIDVMVGSYAEGYRPPGYGFGETSFQIFIAMASRRLMADRFFTDDYRAEIYSQEGLDWVDNNNFRTVLLRHFPEFSDDLANVGNPFFPWDEENEWFLEEYRVRH